MSDEWEMTMEVQLKTLTPLWTGGVETGQMDRIRETGILGSLRWWYEAIVRGLGGDVCDPTSDSPGDRCPRNGEKYCQVCQLFGATGRRRRFGLRLVEDNTQPAWNPPPDMLNIRPPARNRGWYLPPGRVGALTLRITGDEQAKGLLAALFLFLERYGMLGAKPQLGYGVFKVENRSEVLSHAEQWRWQEMGNEKLYRDLPDLRRFGFFGYRFSPEPSGWWTRSPGMERLLGRDDTARVIQDLVKVGMVPLAPSLKNEWRFHRWQGGRRDGAWMFGTLQWRQGDKIYRVRGKIAVSWAYRQEAGWEVRGWAWLQKPSIAADVWKVVTGRDGWRSVVGVDGELKCEPKDQWQGQDSLSIVQLLESTK